MADDISAALLYQIKKEIAERYFGARKAIEEQKATLAEHIQTCQGTIAKAVQKDIFNLYCLLGTEGLIQEFCKVVGLKAKPFYDLYVKEGQKVSTSLLAEQKVRGVTKRGRYKNLFLKCYRQLTRDLIPYQKEYQELMEECLVINEDIALLQTNYNLGEILTFVRSIEDIGSLAGVLGETIVPGQRQDLEDKLAVAKLDCLGLGLMEIPPLPPLSDLKGQIKPLAQKAYQARKN